MAAPRELWPALGGRGTPPGLLGAFSGRLLIVAPGRCLWDDLDWGDPAGFEARWSGDRMAVNYAIMHYPPAIQHAVSLHPEYLGFMLFWRRRAYQCAGEIAVHSHCDGMEPGADHPLPENYTRWNLENAGGTSGLLAIFIGLLLGYRDIVVAGMPMDDSGHFYDAPGEAQGTHRYGDAAIAMAWRSAMPHFEGRVTSLSGRTREWLGAPEEARSR